MKRKYHMFLPSLLFFLFFIFYLHLFLLFDMCSVVYFLFFFFILFSSYNFHHLFFFLFSVGKRSELPSYVYVLFKKVFIFHLIALKLHYC